MTIFLDIETIPGQDPELREQIAKSISPPGNIKKEETIAKWEEEIKPGLIDKAWRETALNPTVGEIICIGFAYRNEPPIMLYRNLNEPEVELLINFYDQVQEKLRDPRQPQTLRKPIWIGHNITSFDLRYIWLRSIIHRVHSNVNIPHDAKPWAIGVYDTYYQWAGMNRNISASQNDIARALGLPGKTDMDGSKVWDAVKAGNIENVVNYCKDDIIQNRHIYHRMKFEPQIIE